MVLKYEATIVLFARWHDRHEEEYGYLDRAEDGSPLSLTGIVIDITDRIAATEALRVSEERLVIALKEARRCVGLGICTSACLVVSGGL